MNLLVIMNCFGRTLLNIWARVFVPAYLYIGFILFIGAFGSSGDGVFLAIGFLVTGFAGVIFGIGFFIGGLLAGFGTVVLGGTSSSTVDSITSSSGILVWVVLGLNNLFY